MITGPEQRRAEPYEERRTLASLVAVSALGSAFRRAALTLLSGLSTAVVARLLGPADYGQLASAIATWTLVLAASDFGFTLVLARDLAVDVARRGALLRAAFELQGGLSVVLAGGMALLALLTASGTPRGEALLILAVSVAFAGFGGARQVFTVLYRPATVVLIDLGVTAVQVAFMIGAASLGLGVAGVAAAVSAGFVVNTLVVAYAGLRLVDPNPSGGGVRRALLGSVLPLGIMAFLSKVYVSIDLVLLGWLVDGPSLGEYAAATKILAILVMLPGLVVGAALPAFATHGSDRDELEALAARVWHWLMVAALPLILATGLFAPLALEITVGPRFGGAVDLLRILTIAGAVGVVSNLVGTILVAKNVVRPLLIQNTVALALNVAGNLVLVPRHGVVASAWLTLATECLVCCGGLLVVRRHMGFRRLGAVSIRPLVALLVLAGAGGALAGTPAIGIPVACATFFATLLALRAWPVELLPRRVARGV